MSPWADRSIFAKLVTMLAIALGIGLGLCGLDFLLAAHGIGKSTEEFGVGPIDGLSLIVMVLSALGLVITLVVWVLGAIIGNLGPGRGSSEPQRLFDRKDKDG
jgi:hypothetical protein